MSAKNEFIIKFIKTIIATGKDMYFIWQSQPLYYKGVHVSGPEYRRRIDVGLSNLQHRKIIKKLPNGKFKFTRKGKEWFRGSLLKHYRSIGIKWDKKWRVAIFYIPQEMHSKRNRLRLKLRSLGFYMIQKSVFVFPYPCEEELAQYCGSIKVGDYVNILIADSLGFIEGEVKKYYDL